MLASLLKVASASPKAPITFIASAFSDTGGVFLTSYRQSIPSGQAGDFLLFLFGCNSDRTYTTPAGWTLLASAPSGTGRRSAVFYKTASSASESAFTMSVVSGGVSGGVVLRFRNVGQLPVNGVYFRGNNVATVTAQAVAAIAGDYVVQYFMNGGSLRPFSTPSVSTGVLFAESNSFQPSISVFYQIGGSSNATSSTTAGNTAAINCVQIRLRG